MVSAFGRKRFQRALVRALAFVLTAAAIRWLPAQTFTPRPGGASPSPRVGSTPGAYANDDGQATIKVNFPNTPIQAIIPVYQQITGKKMILDGSLQGEALKIIGTRLLTKKEAISFIEASLLLNGYAVVKVDDQTVKLIHHSGGKDPSSEGIPVYSSIKDLPEQEEIVHFVLPLQNISPDEAAKAFTTVVKLHPYGAITPVNNTSNIIIKENTATIRSIYELAQIIDVPPAEIANEMIELKRSDAEGIAEIIQEIYEEKEKSESAPRSVRGSDNAPAVPGAPNAANANAQAGTSSSNTNPTAAKVKVIPHRRTNSLLVIARPVDIAYIKALVEKLDKEASEANFLERKLKYMPVVEFITIARDALSRDTDIESDEGSSGGSSSSSGKRSRSSKHSSNSPSTDAQLASRNSGMNNNGFNNGFGSAGGYGYSGGRTEHSSLDDPDDVGAPESVVVGKTLLIADSRSNTLIVNGSPEHILIVDKLIERMDIRPQQIYISTIIGQLNLGQTYDYGVDLLRGLDDFTVRQTPDSTTTTTATTPGSTTGTISTTPATLPPGVVEFPFDTSRIDWGKFNLYGQLGSLSRYIHLLDGNKNFKVLSRPSVYLRNNEKATISSGQRIAVPVSTLSNVGAGVGSTAAVSSSIEYRDVVLKLEVVPLINGEDEVTLKIAQVNDNVVGQQSIGGNNIPTIGTQELVTTVSVKDGSTVVLGGLINEREQTTENGVLFLRRIPVIKHLFNRTEKTKDREELLIFIQPKIVRSSDSLDLPNSIEAGRSKVLEAGLNFATEVPEVRRAEPAR